MKIRQRFAAILLAAFILSGSFPVFATNAQVPKDTITNPESAEGQDEEITEDVSLSDKDTTSEEITESMKEESALEDVMANIPQQKTDCITEEDKTVDTDNGLPGDLLPTDPISEATQEAPIENLPLESTTKLESEDNFPLPDKAPEFHAHIEYWMGYTVIGTFTDFTPDIVKVQTLYSLDGDNWLTGTEDWNLSNIDTNDADKLISLQNQPCLFNIHEPLKSYIAGKIDRFYLKLRLTRKSGLTFESQSAVIERGALQPIPEQAERMAMFSSSISVLESDPSTPAKYRKYAKYQLTVSADATAEEISALLPDTLPVEVQLHHGSDFIAIGIVNCPVTWKPLSLPQLTAGESIIIADAAEEILVPAGTLVSTPVGSFQLEEPLSLNMPPSTDEVRLVLNVSLQDENPTGVLRVGRDGLEVAFHHSPTGATSIQTYVLTEGDSKWTELLELSLSDIFNQPSTINSGYALVLHSDQEPYLSYLTATQENEALTPFFVCLKITGGIYDGKQLILSWPDVYDQLPTLPELGGAGGNEINAGADNKNDSTKDGQRPNLPQMQNDNADNEQQLPLILSPDDNAQTKQALPTHTPEITSDIQNGQSKAPTDECASNLPKKHLISGQHSNLLNPTPGIADTFAESSESQEKSLKAAPSTVQAATKNIADTENPLALSNTETKASATYTKKEERHIPLFPLAAIIAAGGCISMVFHKVTGYSLLRRIKAITRNVAHMMK